jgi:hypothetical protein
MHTHTRTRKKEGGWEGGKGGEGSDENKRKIDEVESWKGRGGEEGEKGGGGHASKPTTSSDNEASYTSDKSTLSIYIHTLTCNDCYTNWWGIETLKGVYPSA